MLFKITFCVGLTEAPARSLVFFPDNSEKNLKCSAIFDCTYKCKTSFESVKGLLFMCIHSQYQQKIVLL